MMTMEHKAIRRYTGTQPKASGRTHSYLYQLTVGVLDPQLITICYGLISYSVCPRNHIPPGIYMVVCYRIVLTLSPKGSVCPTRSCLRAVLSLS